MTEHKLAVELRQRSGGVDDNVDWYDLPAEGDVFWVCGRNGNRIWIFV